MHLVPLLLATSVVLVASNGLRTPDEKSGLKSRIIGGWEVSYPPSFMAALTFLSYDSHIIFQCGATIVDSHWVLTAAHCVRPYYFEPNSLRIHVNTSRWASGGTVHQATKIVFVTDTLEGGGSGIPPIPADDVALVKVNADLGERNAISLADPFVGESLTLFGWGSTEDDGEYSPVLKAIESNVIPQSECMRHVEGWKSLFDSIRHICVLNTRGGGACTGDSGGPAINGNNEQVGITKGRIYAEAPCGLFPGAYSDLSRSRHDIYEIIRKDKEETKGFEN